MAENDIDLLDDLDSTDFDMDSPDLEVPNLDDITAADSDDIDYLSGLNLSDDEGSHIEGDVESFSGEKDKNKNFFKKAVDFVVNFVKTQKILSIAIGSLILLLIVFVILISVLTSKEKKKPEIVPAEKAAELPYDYVLPMSEILDDYTFSRDLKDRWTAEEGERWFEIPDGKMMKELEDKNSENVNEILEAVP